MKVSLDLYNFIQKVLDYNTSIPNDLELRKSSLIYGQSKIYYEKTKLGNYPDDFLHCEPVHIRHKIVGEMYNILPYTFAKAVINDNITPHYPKIKEGDIVINRDDPNSCDIRIVEGADEECILLANGKKDLVYHLPHEVMRFWKEWKILCKSENREDTL